MSTKTCENCGTACGPDDMFCENCGYDFITGSLPADGESPFSAAPTEVGQLATPPSMLSPDPLGEQEADPGKPSDQSAPEVGADGAEESEVSGGPAANGEVVRIRLTVSVDRPFFDQMVNEEIEFPDPVPPAAELELAGPELHIGRTSESRAIHPDIDVADLTGDPAVSSRHAVVRIDDGTYSVIDVGSTNGTFLDSVDTEAMAPGTPVEIKPGSAIYVGAWTRITIVD